MSQHYTMMSQEYNTMSQQYNMMLQEYNTMSQQYNVMLQEYKTMSHDPLPDIWTMFLHCDQNSIHLVKMGGIASDRQSIGVTVHICDSI